MAPLTSTPDGEKGTAHTAETSSTTDDNVPHTREVGDQDEALAIVGEHAQEIDPVLEARVVRKIDLFLIPTMVLGFGMVYYDKAILGSAQLFGMTTDLQLAVVHREFKPPKVDTGRLSWATSIFYFGMLAGLYPLTFALQRFRLGRILGAIVIIWGGITMVTAAVTTWQGLYAQRFFLGFVEAIIPSGFMCITAGNYTQNEQALRQALWYSAAGLFTIIGTALNYGFAQIHGGGLKGWQYIYLLAGAITVFYGVWCFFIPDSPVTAWFLTPEERVVAVERLRRSQTGVRCHKIKASQLKEAALDAKVWLVWIMMAAVYTINGAVTGFGPLIVSTFGYSTLESILFQFPLGGLAFLSIITVGFLGYKVKNVRLIMLMACCIPVIIGCALIWKCEWSHRAAAPIVGYTILGFFGPAATLTVVIGMANVAGGTKKSFMAAAIYFAYCVGNIIGPQMVKSQNKGQHYPELWLGLIICFVITIIAAAILYYLLWKENKRRDALELNEEERDKLAFKDLTDQENPHFRYVL